MALMIPTITENCRPEVSPNTPGTRLRVYTSSSSAITASPAVARWDWNNRVRLQSITIRCGPNDWCDIGREGGWGPDGGIHTAVGSAEMQDRFAVRGWHDRQFLAPPEGLDGTYQAAATGGDDVWTAPSPILGTVVPRPGIERITDLSDWTPVAQVYIEGDPQGYRAKYGFVQALLGTEANRLALCKGSACIGQTPKATIAASPSCQRAYQIKQRENLPEDAILFARVTPPNGGQPMTMCAVYREHMGVPIPGTMRWRWMADDEGIWAPCIFGCCQVLGGGF